jgi:putative two-component system response regulator
MQIGFLHPMLNQAVNDGTNLQFDMNQDQKLLIIDDDRFNILILIEALTNYPKISVCMDSSIALESVFHCMPDLILLDIFMPHFDGFEVCRIIKSNPSTKDIPIIFITSDSDPLTLFKAFQFGAVDFVKKPFSMYEVQARVQTHLRLKIAEEYLKEQNAELESKVAHRTRRLQEKNLEIEHAQRETISRLSLAADMRDTDTGSHIRRIQAYSRLLAIKSGMSEDVADQLGLASSMHDLGKIGIPDHILLKPGKLTVDEFHVMKMHTIIGANALEGSHSALLRVAHAVALNHHERWDGTGYPKGLREKEIPFEARIVGLVDAFDAMTSRRPYKDPLSPEQALSIIQSERGRHFDPLLVDLFTSSFDEVLEIIQYASACDATKQSQ